MGCGCETIRKHYNTKLCSKCSCIKLSYRDGRPKHSAETEDCLNCGGQYYPPENHPKSPNGLGKCKSGHYLPICNPCKVIRRKKTREEIYNRWQARVKLNRPPRKRDIILDQLRKEPHTIEELLYKNNTIKSYISSLRKSGYDIRFERRYILVREPKESIIDN